MVYCLTNHDTRILHICFVISSLKFSYCNIGLWSMKCSKPAKYLKSSKWIIGSDIWWPLTANFEDWYSFAPSLNYITIEDLLSTISYQILSPFFIKRYVMNVSPENHKRFVKSQCIPKSDYMLRPMRFMERRGLPQDVDLDFFRNWMDYIIVPTGWCNYPHKKSIPTI